MLPEFEVMWRAAIQGLTAEMVMTAVNQLPVPPRRFILKTIGVRNTDKVSPSMAAQVLARLRARPGVVDDFAHAAFMPAMAFAAHQLSFAEWEALAGTKPLAATRVYVNHPELVTFGHALWKQPRPFARLALAAAAQGVGNGPTIALNLLAEFDTVAAKMYFDPVEANDGRPDLITLDEASPVGRLTALTGKEVDAEVTAPDLMDRLREELPEDETSELDDIDVEEEDPRQVSKLLATAARSWADDLDDGALASPGFTGPMHRLATRVWEQANRCGAGDLEDLIQALDAARGPKVDPARWWLLRLVNASGPAEVVGLQEAKKLASEASLVDAHEADEAFAALIRVGDLGVEQRAGRPFSGADLLAANGAAMAGLPQWTAVVSAVGFGLVTLAAPETGTADAGDPAKADQEADNGEQQERLADADEDAAEPQAAPVSVEISTAGAEVGERPASPEVEGDLVAHGDGTAAATEEVVHDAPPPTPMGIPLDIALEAADPEPAAVDDAVSEMPVVPVPAGLPSDLAKYLGRTAGDSASVPEERAAAEIVAPARDEPAQASAPDDNCTVWGSPASVALQTELLGAGRFGLAADLAQVTGANAAQVAARQLAAFAAVLVDPTGAVATEISQINGAIDREDIGDDRVGLLAAWAAAAKTALLAPSAGPAEVLEELKPAISSSAALAEVTDALVDAARQGVVVVAPEVMKAVGATATATVRVAELVDDARQLVERAKTRTIKYVPANDVYLAWLAPGGALHDVLATVCADNREAVGAVRKQIVDRLRGSAERNIDHVFSAQKRNKGRGAKIVAQPRTQLVTRWDEAVDVAASWAVAVDELTVLTQAASSGSWQKGALSRLRERIAPHRNLAEQDLERMCADAGVVPDASTGPLGLLTVTFLASDGQVDAEGEPVAAYALHSELLASNLPLSPKSLLPDGVLPVDVLVTMAKAPAVATQDVYDRLAERGAHDLTDVLVTAVIAQDEEVGLGMMAARVRDMNDQDSQVQDYLNALEDDVDVRRVHGVLGDTLWTRAASVVEALKEPGRQDYERIRSAAALLAEQLDVEREAAVAETVEQIQTLAQDNANVAEHAERLTTLARQGQVASAQEQLQQLIEGQDLPGADVHGGLLAGFFPRVPAVMAGAVARERLEQLNRALREGTHNETSSALAMNGVDLLGLPTGRAKQAREAFTAWGELSSTTPQGRPGTSESGKLAVILRQAGIEFTGQHTEQGGSRERQMVTLTGLTTVGKALTPALGSRRSADGNSLKVLLVRKASTPASIVESLANQPADATVLMLWLGRSPLSPADWRAVGESARGRVSAPPVVVIDPSVLVYLASQVEPRLSTLAAITLPFTAANPYRDTPGDTAPEMFYGRTDERAALVDMSGSSFVSGGRQLGKSALLRQASREFEAASPKHVAIVEMIYSVREGTDPREVWPPLWRVLRDRGIVTGHVPADNVPQAVYDGVRVWLREDPERRLLLMLDEADEFLDGDASGNRFENVDWFRKLMLGTNRAFKVVLAGLHATARFESLPNQPLSHLGRPIVVGPLRPSHANALLTGPLAAIGYHFDSDVTVASVLSQANNMPAQLQLIGQAIVEHMSSKTIGPDAPPAVITEADVDAAFTPTLRDALRGKFLLTLELDKRYKVIAYVMAHEAHEHGSDASLTLAELVAACRSVWPAGFDGLGADAVRGLVAECVDLGVLARDESHYRLRTPAVRRLLGTALEVLEVLDDAASLEAPAAYDGSVFRRPVKCMGKAISPLTERQLTEVFVGGPRVVVVAGSPATGLNTVARSLEEFAQEISHAGTVHPVINARPDGVAAAVGKATDRTRLIVDVRQAGHGHVTSILNAAEAALAGCRRDVSVIVIAGPMSASAWVNHPNLVELDRVDAAGMRLLAGAELVTVHDPANQARVGKELGGWLTLLAALRNALSEPGPQVGEGDVITQVVADRDSKPGRLADDAGVKAGSGTTLARAASAVHDLTHVEREPRADIIALLEVLEDREDLVTAATTDGFTSLAEVFDALVALRVVVSDADGKWGVEPVLAADLMAKVGQT